MGRIDNTRILSLLSDEYMGGKVIYCLIRQYSKHERHADIFYIGMTSNPKRRIKEHNGGLYGKFANMVIIMRGGEREEGNAKHVAKRAGFTCEIDQRKLKANYCEIEHIKKLLRCAVLLSISQYKKLGKSQAKYLQSCATISPC